MDLYSFVYRGNLTKLSLDDKNVSNAQKSNASTVDLLLNGETLKKLPLDRMDQNIVERAKMMASVYVAIASFENSARDFVTKILQEKYGENWWEHSVSDKIRKKAESRKAEEDKIKWHNQRGESLINYTEITDLSNIMYNNLESFEDFIISIEWVKQIFTTIDRSRNVIMHSGELGTYDIERLCMNIRDWLNQVG
ncbi:MAG: hypothetical protein IJO33_00170 [Bacilli bacterium]|nr:hypothetical protein [Bacilli bacterium]